MPIYEDTTPVEEEDDYEPYFTGDGWGEPVPLVEKEEPESDYDPYFTGDNWGEPVPLVNEGEDETNEYDPYFTNGDDAESDSSDEFLA